MKKLAILAMGLSMLLCSCGNSPLYKGLTDKKYTYTDNSGNTQTYIFHEDNLTKYDNDWQNVKVLTITWTKEKINFEIKNEIKEYIAVYYYYTDSYHCHRIGFFRNSKNFYTDTSSKPYTCK